MSWTVGVRSGIKEGEGREDRKGQEKWRGLGRGGECGVGEGGGKGRKGTWWEKCGSRGGDGGRARGSEGGGGGGEKEEGSGEEVGGGEGGGEKGRGWGIGRKRLTPEGSRLPRVAGGLTMPWDKKKKITSTGTSTVRIFNQRFRGCFNKSSQG